MGRKKPRTKPRKKRERTARPRMSRFLQRQRQPEYRDRFHQYVMNKVGHYTNDALNRELAYAYEKAAQKAATTQPGTHAHNDAVATLHFLEAQGVPPSD